MGVFRRVNFVLNFLKIFHISLVLEHVQVANLVSDDLHCSRTGLIVLIIGSGLKRNNPHLRHSDLTRCLQFITSDVSITGAFCEKNN